MRPRNTTIGMIGAAVLLNAGAIRPVNEVRIDIEDDDFDLFDTPPPKKGRKNPPILERLPPREPPPEDINREERAAAKRARKNAKRKRDMSPGPNTAADHECEKCGGFIVHRSHCRDCGHQAPQ